MAEKQKKRKANAVSAFFRETYGELSKVNWPTWPEAWQLTKIVLAVMFAMGVLLGATDLGARNLLNLVLGIQ